MHYVPFCCSVGCHTFKTTSQDGEVMGYWFTTWKQSAKNKLPDSHWSLTWDINMLRHLALRSVCFYTYTALITLANSLLNWYTCNNHGLVISLFNNNPILHRTLTLPTRTYFSYSIITLYLFLQPNFPMRKLALSLQIDKLIEDQATERSYPEGLCSESFLGFFAIP